MKHLKKFNESKFDDFKDMVDNLHQLCMDFKDDGLPVQIEPNDDIKMKVKSMNIPTSDSVSFFVRIYSDFIKTEKPYIVFQKYIVNILSIIDYMKSEGYKTNIEICDPYIAERNTKYIGLDISSDDFIKAYEDGKYIPNIYRGKLKEGIIRLNQITSVDKIDLTFDKIDKNYDI